MEEDRQKDEKKPVLVFILTKTAYILKTVGLETINIIRIRHAMGQFIYYKKKFDDENNKQKYRPKDDTVWQQSRPYLIKCSLIALSILLFKVLWPLTLCICTYYFIKPVIRYNRDIGDYRGIVDYYKKYKPNLTPMELYTELPLRLMIKDNIVNEYLKQNISGVRNAQISFTKAVRFHKNYGTVRIIEITDIFKRNEATSLTNHAITDFYFIPQKLGQDEDVFTKAYFTNQKNIYQALDYLLLDDLDGFISKIKQDNNINQSFKELRNTFKIKEEKEKELIEEQELIEYVENYELSEEFKKYLIKIRRNKKVWGFNYYNGKGISFKENSNYALIKCQLLTKNIKEIKALKDELEKEFNKSITIQQLPEKSTFNLMILKKPLIDKFKISYSKVVNNYNENGEFFIGDSLTGFLSAKFTNQANHFIVTGVSGSGKTFQIVNTISQLLNMEVDYTRDLYNTLFVTSSSKLGDFAPFKKRGAVCVEGVENQERVFNQVLEELTNRERLFMEYEVANFKEYEKKTGETLDGIILVADEWENSFKSSDAKQSKILLNLLVSILNVARSSKGVVIIGAQSILKEDVGAIKDKMTVVFSGSNNSNILNQVDKHVSGYYTDLTTAKQDKQGVFFFKADNLIVKEESIFFGENGYTLVQTPEVIGVKQGLTGLKIKEKLQEKTEIEEVNILELEEL